MGANRPGLKIRGETRVGGGGRETTGGNVLGAKRLVAKGK